MCLHGDGVDFLLGMFFFGGGERLFIYIYIIFFYSGGFFVVWGSCKYFLRDNLSYFHVFDIFSGRGGGSVVGFFGGRVGWKYIGRVRLMCLQGVDFFYWRSRGEGLGLLYIYIFFWEGLGSWTYIVRNKLNYCYCHVFDNFFGGEGGKSVVSFFCGGGGENILGGWIWYVCKGWIIYIKKVIWWWIFQVFT